MMRASAVLLLFSGSVWSSAGCSSTTRDTGLGPGCGTSRCDNADWPELVVAQSVNTDAGTDAGTVDIQVSAVYNGAKQQPYHGGDCPDGIDVIDCAYQFWCGPADQMITLQVAVDGRPPSTKVIAMREFNHCGNDLSYVHFQVQGDPPAAVIGDPVYVSPCRMLP